MLDQAIEESVNKLNNRRIDPMTGELFNMEINTPKFESQNLRLQRLPGDDEQLVKQRYQHYIDQINMLEEAYKNCLVSYSGDRMKEQVYEGLRENVINPIF